MTDFPASKTARGAIFARTGLKVGTNYAKYYARRALGEGTEDKAQLHRDNAADIFSQFTRLRGTALKLAQSLSLDTGVLPDEFVEVMSQAQYRVPPMSQGLVRSRIKAELGAYPEQLFSGFEPQALAAASIGQVHRARWGDTPVAVKIQYPNVRATIQSDLVLARTLFGRLVGPQAEVYFAEIRDKLLEETDYLNEARQLALFGRLYEDPRIVLPTAVDEATTQRVLTMTFVEGQHLQEYLGGGPTQAARDAYGQLLWDFFHAQIEAGQYTLHADLHPGNFLFRADGRLGVIDFGCVKRFPPEFIATCMRLLHRHIADEEGPLKALYYEAGILDPARREAAAEAEEMAYFRGFGRTLVQPYLDGYFDFGEAAYRQRLNAFFKQGPDVRPQVSQHFIFLNKVQMGLYSLLMKLGARVDTQYSRAVIGAEGAAQEA